MGMGAGAGQPTSSGMNGLAPQPTAQPGAKGGTGSNVPTSTNTANNPMGGKGGSSVTGGQPATNTSYPAYNPPQNTFGAIGSTNVYNPVSASMPQPQNPQFPQSTLQLPQGGFQPNYGMYQPQVMPQQGGGMLGPAKTGLAQAYPQQPSIGAPPPGMMPQQNPFGFNNQQMNDFQQKQQEFENQINAAVQANPAFAQREQLIKQFGLSQNSQPTPQQMQQLDQLSSQINSDPALQQVRNAQQQYMQQAQQQYQPYQTASLPKPPPQLGMMPQVQLAHGPVSPDNALQNYMASYPQGGGNPALDKAISLGQMPPPGLTPQQLSDFQLKQQAMQGGLSQQPTPMPPPGMLPQNPGQMPQAPTQQHMGRQDKRQEAQRALQQFRPGMTGQQKPMQTLGGLPMGGMPQQLGYTPLTDQQYAAFQQQNPGMILG